jgi:hypothetical protein
MEYAGLDLHKSFCQIKICTKEGELIKEGSDQDMYKRGRIDKRRENKYRDEGHRGILFRSVRSEDCI